MSTPVSQIVVVSLNCVEGEGVPLLLLATYPGGVAELVTYAADGTVARVSPVEGPQAVLQKVAGLRRIAQRYPSEYVTLNITHGDTTLVA
jgi:hypothetical protein